ncbi:hypothetical protein H4Q26_008000 [Puccinia striiformis f. sp. tritici PST-130]|nr:hypothetical protein H4Q26_008000 [Puccinia striiformis f. sp. tritici PST-130]
MYSSRPCIVSRYETIPLIGILDNSVPARLLRRPHETRSTQSKPNHRNGSIIDFPLPDSFPTTFPSFYLVKNPGESQHKFDKPRFSSLILY